MWARLAIKDFLVSLFAFPLSPIIAYLSLKEKSLPDWAWPFLTHDNDIDGDGGHWERWPKNKTLFDKWIRRTAWLWRNRGYNYSYHISGVVPRGELSYKGSPLFWKSPDAQQKGGWCYAKCDNAWMLFAWIPYSLFGVKRGVRVYLGWKLRHYCEHPDTPAERAMLVTHINPFKGVI